ncbi:MAG: Fic family protein [Pseudomonadota bacterium]|nr:Fic family protein [Pseudomonadota bacterium]
MATPSEKLAGSLEVLHALQARGIIAIRSKDLTRTHRERLLENGFLQEVMKGWYIASRPDEGRGDSTAWYATFRDFCAAYLNERFSAEWCLSPEQSLSLHAGDRAVPGQLLVRSPKARNNVTRLAYDTSILEVRSSLPTLGNTEDIERLRVFSLASALVACAPGFFTQKPTDVRTALSMVPDASELLSKLLEGGHSIIAGRLAGAFRNIGRDRIADDILETMRAGGYTVRETDPFATRSTITISPRERSPYVNRLRLMWTQMRPVVMDQFPPAPGLPTDTHAYMQHVEDVYVTDAYHSLSIEGYRVSPELIERVRRGNWNPDHDKADREQADALAARGYYQAFQAVKSSVGKVLQGENPGTIADKDHGTWYREMFAPSTVAGVVKPADLAGYRNGPVFIRKSMHVPPGHEAVRDLIPAYFDLLQGETETGVRIVLGHFVFVYIHPYMDGNGRMGRFLMNVMLAGGGFPWTVIPVEEHNTYMAALEEASVRQNIAPFTRLIARLVDAGLKGDPGPGVP